MQSTPYFPSTGYKILVPPPGYVPIRTPARKLMATPTSMGCDGFMMLEEDRNQTYDLPAEIPGVGNLPFLKKTCNTLIKNGTPPMRKTPLRQITDKARDFGAGPLFKQILPLLMSQNLDQERHLLVLVRPYVHKILVVIEPLLIDEDYFARC
ncbi:23539_t:CDS:2, partial [Cetraspora pellucida]